MSIEKHINVLDYTLQSLLRRKFKNAGIVLVFTFVIFILGSILFLAYSFKREAVLILENSPDLIVQRTMAGRHELIPADMARTIEKIPGVSRVEPRYWGYYYDSLVGANYTVLSAAGRIAETNRLLKGRLPGPDERGAVAVGSGVARARFVGIDGDLIMLSASGSPLDLRVVGIFDTASALLASDLIVIGHKDFTDLFNLPPGMATDLIVNVPNEAEAPVVARKIHERFFDTRPILRSEIIRTYDAVFGWRSGLVLTIFAGALVAFIILAWDKATGLSAEERKEIGILKALGWETSDILEMKFWEGLVISLSSFLAGVILAYVHVFFFGASVFAPALKGWSVLYPQFRLAPYINAYQIATLMMLTVIPYIASTIIPSWKAAITDPDEVVRG
jgi:ABC-type lipoprotein release transport system permease subunit